MNALELADYLDADSENLTSGCNEAAVMLRKQHAQLTTAGEALTNANKHIEALERENSELRKSLDSWNEFARKSGLSL